MSLETLRSRIAGKELFARAAEYDSEGNKISTSLESKQDVISDIEEIRSGAAAGATAYQKPNTGIPSSDMTSEVQTSLGLADSAVQPAALAPEYDSTATYAAGDHCMHLGKYYRCDTAISTAEAWTPAHWTETNIIGDLSTVLTSKAGASGGTELSLVTTGEKYTWNNWVDASYTIPPETITIGSRAYRIVTIGNQQWMAENLDYTWSDLKVDQYGVGSYDIQRKTNYYDNNPTLYSQYGRMYDWYAAAHLNSNLTTIIGSRLASDGWHVPSPTDFDTLVTYAGGSSTAGTKLKATSGWSGRGGTDDYGFTWLPGGTTGNSGGQIAYYRGGQWGFIWAISASSSSSTVYPYAAYFDDAGCNTRSMNKGDEVSIRLVRNLT